MKTLAERFWPKVDRRGPDECWPWIASMNNRGYGQINEGGSGRPILAHRAAWLLTNGSLPDDKCVCHRCDNPPCCNPAHLFLGSVADNNHDMARKGRSGRARLSPEQVRQIRDRVAADPARGIRSRLAREFGVSLSTISGITTNANWRHTP